MFFGLGVINMDLGGLIAGIVAIIGAIVCFVKVKEAQKNHEKKTDLIDKKLDKEIQDRERENEKMRCELKEFKNLVVEVALMNKDIGFIKKSIKTAEEKSDKIIELLTK